MTWKNTLLNLANFFIMRLFTRTACSLLSDYWCSHKQLELSRITLGENFPRPSWLRVLKTVTRKSGFELLMLKKRIIFPILSCTKSFFAILAGFNARWTRLCTRINEHDYVHVSMSTITVCTRINEHDYVHASMNTIMYTHQWTRLCTRFNSLTDYLLGKQNFFLREWSPPCPLTSNGGSISKVVGPKTNDQIFFIYNQGRQWRSEKF